MRVSIGIARGVVALLLFSGVSSGAFPDDLLADPSFEQTKQKQETSTGPTAKLIASFENGNPFSGGEIVGTHATDGRKALRVDKGYASLEQAQDWLGYDFLKADLFLDGRKPLNLYVEIRDTATDGYWTRVNYTTVVPPGKSTLIIPVKQLYVGEKARPGRMLILNGITRLVFGVGDQPPGPLFLDNIRLERDDAPEKVSFDGLLCVRLRDGEQPGHGRIHRRSRRRRQYSRGRGYGLKDARIWRAFDALQPEPLYQDFICIEAGGLAIDVPNGRYRVFVNIDSPSGFWGEYQTFRQRSIVAEGRPVVRETMDFDAFKKKYFRFWNVEDLPGDNTFDKYQKAYFREKRFDVDVKDGQLNLEFQGENFACSVSAVVDLSRRAGGARGGVPQIYGSQAPILLRQLLQARSSGTERRAAASPPQQIDDADSSRFSAIPCKTSRITIRRRKTKLPSA